MNTGRTAGSLNLRRSSASTASYAPVVKPEQFTPLAQPAAADGIDYAQAIVHFAARGVVTRQDVCWRVHPL